MSIVVVNQAGTDWPQFWATVGGGIVTLAAVGLALGVAIVDGRRRGADERRRDEERSDAQAAQARLVNFETDPSGATGEPAKLLLVNHSLQPVHNLRLMSVVGIDQRTKERFVASELAGGLDLHRRHARLRPYGASDSSHTWLFSPDGWAPEGQPDARQPWRPVSSGGEWGGADWECRYQFTDNNGLRWERLNNEPPVRVMDAAAA